MLQWEAAVAKCISFRCHLVLARSHSIYNGAVSVAFGRGRRHKTVLPIILPASEFDDILGKQTRAETAYTDSPLAALSPKTRGEVMATLARQVDTDLNPDARFTNPALGVCMGGKRRGWNNAEYDWMRDGCRVECKSAQLSWDTSLYRWKFTFANIKFACGRVRSVAAFDELILALSLPDAIHIYKHDLRLGITKQGKATEPHGDLVRLYGARGMYCWRSASDAILCKLRASSCAHLATVSFGDPRLDVALAEHSQRLMIEAYVSVPLASSTSRGKRIEAIVQAVDRDHLHMLSPMCSGAAQPFPRICAQAPNASFDWLRGALRIECKSAQLVWKKSSKRWSFTFSNVKFEFPPVRPTALFDELLLALYTPIGVHIYRHDFKLGVSTVGKATSSQGHHITFCGPRGEEDWRRSYSVIFGRLQASKCELLALVTWNGSLDLDDFV